MHLPVLEFVQLIIATVSLYSEIIYDNSLHNYQFERSKYYSQQISPGDTVIVGSLLSAD